MNQSRIKSSGLKDFAAFEDFELFKIANRKASLSAEDVYRLLLSEDMDIGLATIYRVLTQFEQSWLVGAPQF